jgi:hypothetical protein
MKHSPRQRIRLAVAVAVLASVFALTLFSVGAISNPRPAALPQELQRAASVANTGTSQAERSMEAPAGRVRWTVTSYDSAEGPCVVVVAEEVQSVDRGQLASCGPLDDPLLRWSMGGIEIASQWFNVAYGQVAFGASYVRLTLGDGSVRVDAGFRQANGLWIVVIPAGPFDARSDFVRIEVLGEGGVVMTSQELPSLVEYRKQAQSAGSEAANT